MKIIKFRELNIFLQKTEAVTMNTRGFENTLPTIHGDTATFDEASRGMTYVFQTTFAPAAKKLCTESAYLLFGIENQLAH